MTAASTPHSAEYKFAVGLLAGAGSGVLNKTVIAPLERIKILYQIQGMQVGKPAKYHGIWQTLTLVAKEEGFWALWKGNGANCVRIVPNYACKFTFNDYFKDLVRKPGTPLTFNQMMIAGTSAGMVQVILTYPLELVRTRLSLASEFGKNAPYNGIIDCFRRTVRTEGYRGLYKGIGPTMASGAPYTGIQMSCFDVFKRYFPKDALGTLSAGACAGIVSQTLMYPGDTVRRRMQANGLEGMPRTYKNSIDCFRKIVQGEGALALFSGCRANVLRAVPGTAIQFWSFEAIKRVLGVEPISG